jgi:hypothetical protein
MALDLSTKPHNVTCRISSLRKKYGLNIICTSNVAGAGSSSGTASAAKTRQASSSAAAAAAGVVKTGRMGKPAAGKKKNGVGFGNGVSFGGQKKTAVQVRTVRKVFVDDDEGEDGKGEYENEGEGEAGTGKTKKTKGNNRVDPDTEMDRRSDADGQAGAVVKMEKTEDRRPKTED